MLIRHPLNRVELGCDSFMQHVLIRSLPSLPSDGSPAVPPSDQREREVTFGPGEAIDVQEAPARVLRRGCRRERGSAHLVALAVHLRSATTRPLPGHTFTAMPGIHAHSNPFSLVGASR